MAIDSYLKDPENWVCREEWLEEIKTASHRDFTTGFYHEKPDENEHLYTEKSYVRNYDFIGMVLDYDAAEGIATVEQRNRFFSGDAIEIIGPHKEVMKSIIEKMWDEDGNEIEVAPHPKQIVKMKIDQVVEPYHLLRKKLEQE